MVKKDHGLRTSEPNMDHPRKKAYIWTTWLTGLLAGTDKCMWRSWFKAHFRYTKREGDGGFDLAEWTKQHDVMTNARAKKLEAQGWTVRLEDDNSFKLDGAMSTLSGKPDLLALKEEDKLARVIDEKSGKPRDSDMWQVLIYMFALPLLWAKGWRIDGEVEYRHGSLEVPAEQLTLDVTNKIVAKIRAVGGDDEPPRTPSPQECRFCDILNCPDRWTGRPNVADASDYF